MTRSTCSTSLSDPPAATSRPVRRPRRVQGVFIVRFCPTALSALTARSSTGPVLSRAPKPDLGFPDASLITRVACRLDFVCPRPFLIPHHARGPQPPNSVFHFPSKNISVSPAAKNNIALLSFSERLRVSVVPRLQREEEETPDGD